MEAELSHLNQLQLALYNFCIAKHNHESIGGELTLEQKRRLVRFLEEFSDMHNKWWYDYREILEGILGL